MAPGRCSVCHCYPRNSPPGFPNHRPVTAMGLNCTMKSLGRHFRNQKDTSNPTYDYEGCNFFTSGALYSNLPYPDDVSLGPLTDQQPPASVSPQQSELSQILSMLRDQKLESEKANERMNLLQAQVNSILIMNHLRADPAINTGGNAVLAEAIRTDPPLNPIPQAQVNVLGPAVNHH